MELLSLLFPRICVGCGKIGSYLCVDCVKGFRVVNPICPMCGKGSIYGVVHTKCRTKLGIDGVVRVFGYRGLVKKLIKKLKYKRVTDLVDTVIDLLVSMGEFEPLEKGSWLVVPVPLHKTRLRQRGFNQTFVLSERIAKYFGWRFDGEVLERKVETESQVNLDVVRRKENVKGVFEVVKGKTEEVKKAIRILIVDDVWTTGATMRECGKVLKRSGVKEVWGLTVAS